MTERQKLERQFHAAMLALCERCTAEVYNPLLFRSMLADRGGLVTAKDLINRPIPSDGYFHLASAGRLDLTVESFVDGHPEFWPLFTPHERAKCKRLAREFVK